MSKQTAVEWLYNTIDDEIVNYLYGEINLNELSIAMLKLKEQAKAMHKEEIVDAFGIGAHYKSTSLIGYHSMADEYYNETYKGGEQ